MKSTSDSAPGNQGDGALAIIRIPSWAALLMRQTSVYYLGGADCSAERVLYVHCGERGKHMTLYITNLTSLYFDFIVNILNSDIFILNNVVCSHDLASLGGKASHCGYNPASPLFRALYHIQNHKEYALLEVVTTSE